MSNENKNKVENKVETKTLTKEEILKLKTEAVQEAKEQVMVYEMNRTWHPFGGKLTPKFKFEVYGGDPKVIEEIAVKVQAIMLDIQSKTST